MKRSTKSYSGLFLLLATCSLQALAHTPEPKPAFVEVPFELVHGAIIVPATLNGAGPIWMMLDTGADPSIVDLGTGKDAGLKIAARGQQGSGGGTSINLAYATSLPNVKIGGLTATNVDALAMDLSKLSAKLERPIGGVLGYSLFKKRIVQFDYPQKRVRFYARAPSCPRTEATCTTLLFRYHDDILATGITVDGKPVTTNVDTGSNSFFQLTPAAVEKLGLREDLARAHDTSSVGFNGDLKNREGSVRNVTVGTISVEDPPVVFFGKGMGMDREAWDLRIGSGFLKDFVVTLDFPRGQITLTRSVNPSPPN